MSGDDDVSEDDTHFVIYSKIAIEKTLRNVSDASTFTAEYWEQVSVGNNRLPACPGQANFDPGR